MIHANNPDWGSHIPSLIMALQESYGPVLELGMGISSTPLLHMLCFAQDRLLVSYDNEPEFIKSFRKYKSHNHEINLVEDWDKIDLDRAFWGTVLVDHKPDDRRKEEIKRLKDKAMFIVVHDTEPANESLYNYSEIYPLFKHRFDYTKAKVHTTVLSNFHDLNFFRNS